MAKVQLRSLCIGGTGVTGIPLVNGLLDRGHHVTIINSGTHPPPRSMAEWYYDGRVTKLVAIANKEASLRETLGKNFHFNHVFSMYGKLKMIAALFAENNEDGSKRCDRFYSIGGPVMDVWGTSADKLAVDGSVFDAILDEKTRVCTDDGTIWGKPNSHSPKIDQMIIAEQAVFRNHPTATHFRYPLVYGPLQLIPAEWFVVKRCLDKRPFIILPTELAQSRKGVVYAENAAAMILAALDKPEASRGETFQVVDSQSPTCTQWAKIIARALGHELEVVVMPGDLARCTLPILNGPATGEDKVHCTESFAITARWLAKNHPSDFTATLMQDPFDYAAEDALVEHWRKGDMTAMRRVRFSSPPGFGHFYYGPCTNPGDGKSPETRHAGTYDPTKVTRDPIVLKGRL